MATERLKGLGRGLEALLGPALLSGTAPGRDEAAAGDPTVLRLSQMVAGVYQPRTRMDEGALQELAESIRRQGIMQPILVRRLDAASAAAKDAEYEIIAGERRFRAARLAGLDSVPVLVRDVPNEAAAAMSLIENIQREDLNPLEEAHGIQRLVAEFGLTHETAARAVGRSRSATSNLLRLLHLAEPAQVMLMAGDIDMGHARALLMLEKDAQVTAAHQIAERRMSVRETETMVKKLASGPTPITPALGTQKSGNSSPDLLQAERDLADLLLARVNVKVVRRDRSGEVGEGFKIAIELDSMQALTGMIERLRQSAPATR
ncbi:ParB/RepB/Spo0J family partition protein [Polaromonas sp.]|uniref:ParB/RepB/Spo0J family partition protein n=1 Tax=Polaromonas sp. TaxID=1869339 RepID=UPI003529F9F5